MDKAPVREGQLLAGKYKIERMLAKGGMGVVVAALHEGLDQRVALKFLLPEGASNSDAVGRFLREARAAVRLRSEHVAKVLDVGTLDTGSPYIVMEYLEGRDLQALLTERGKLPAHTAVSYVLQACEAIAEAHAHGIVHRDLEPGNLFLTRRNDGSPCIKVLDFGISKLPSGQLEAGMTKTSALIGTPYYISPEQLRSSKNADARSDIWALGMILYELLTGSVAFPRDTLPELCTAIICDAAPDFQAHGVDVTPELSRVVMRCLEKSPEHRYQTLAELAAALATFVADGSASAERISRILSGRGSGGAAPPKAANTSASIAEPSPVMPGPDAAGAETRSESARPSVRPRSFDGTALSPRSPLIGRSTRLVAASVLGAAMAAGAVWWMVDTMRPTSSVVATRARAEPVMATTIPDPPPIALTVVPAAPPPASAPAAPVASEAQLSSARRVPPRRITGGRTAAAPTRLADADDFGFRK